MNYDALSPAASLSPPSISSGDTDSDDQHASSPSNSFAYYQPNTSHSSSSSHTSVSESPNLDFAQYLPDIGLQATMQELGMSIDGWEQWNDKPIDPAMLFVDLDGLGGNMPVTPATTHSTLSPANLPITPPAPVVNPGAALPKNKFSTARASHLLSVPRAPSPEIRSTKVEPLSAADDIAQRILARTRPAAPKQPQQFQHHPQPHVPGPMPGIVMPSLPPVPRSGAANATNVPNMQDMNGFMPMQMDPNEAALTNEYIAMLQNAQSMPDFFSTAFNTSPQSAAPQQPPTLPTLPNTNSNGNQPTTNQAPPPLRTKTSHTTIERRYRTNLNTRITALRHAVPALRVLDKAAFPNEQPDEHGLCDGVRPARKASKASVLGKATEYIRVLKRREKRLEGAVGGLKALVRVLSGEQVVREWEAEWVRVHGGPETDSIGVDGDGNDGEGDGDDDDSDGDEPKAKRAKATAALSVPAAAPLAAGEKRKRGRPRKSPQTETFPQPVVAIAPAPASSGENGKYLLGVFLFFSFFKGGARHAPAHGHTHVGSVISRAGSVISSPSEVVQSPWDFAHLMHTVLSIALLAWVVWGWVSSLTESKHKKDEGRIKVAKNVLTKGRAASTLTRAWTAAQLYFAGPEAGVQNETQWDAILGLLLAPVCAPVARRFWARARESLDYANAPIDADGQDAQTLFVDNSGENTPLSSGFLTPRPLALDAPEPKLVHRAVLGLDVEDAEAGYVSALSGSGIAGDEVSTDDVLDFIAAAHVVDVMFELAVKRLIEASGGESDVKVAKEEADEAVRHAIRLGAGLKSQRVRDTVKVWENVCGTHGDLRIGRRRVG
ncbi:hypothetical protein FRC12_016807 [Ceratobasidium sp. 428]|nr:hypothetical protein FRC12_016807 [Ceratobasidium sp. 428]